MWAWTVRHSTGLDFAKIERLLSPTCFSARDGGGYSQPLSWNGYGTGRVSPVGNGRRSKAGGIPLDLAEELCPGAREIYDSVLWKILRTKELGRMAGVDFAHRLTPSVKAEILQLSDGSSDPWTALMSLSVDSLSELAKHPHIDVLSALLMVLARVQGVDLQVQVSALTRWWLMHVTAREGALQSVRSQLLSVLESCVPKLGRLSGANDLSPQSTAVQHLEEAHRAVYSAVFFGKW